MASESNETVILDEIDRLFVSYEKAKEYLTKISTGINKHTDFWQTRRPMIAEQARSASMDFLLPRTQRMNELIIEAVQNLCRVDLLIEQVVRLEPKLPAAHQTRPMTSSFSSRSIDRVVSPSITVPRFPTVATYTTPKFPPSMPAESNPSPRMMTQPVLPVPVVKRSTNTTPAPPLTLSGRASRVAEATADIGFFQPIEQQSPYPSTRMNPAASADGGKVRVKLQRIASGTRWSQARIPVIDSLSAFYVQNIEKKAQDAFLRMITELDNHYNALEQSKRLSYIQDIAIGDFGVTRIGEDARWCRARVVSHEEDDRIRALDVDSGNLDIKFIDEFFPLDQKFVELPARAVACTLSEACPISNTNDNTLWLPETIEIFRKEVMDKRVEIYFVEGGSSADAWPLHFVRIFVGNQSVTNVLTLKQHIDPKPNAFIAEQLSATLTEQEYILFNVPMGDDVYKGS